MRIEQERGRPVLLLHYDKTPPARSGISMFPSQLLTSVGTMDELRVIARIEGEVAAGLAALDEHYRAWAEAHLVSPRPVMVQVSTASDTAATFWLVTAETGTDDSGYRIVYDADMEMFGLIARVPGRGDVLLGLYGDFARTVIGM